MGHEAILWAAFIGAWALVAGPVYQAMLELRAEDLDVERIHEVALSVRPPAPPVKWWLLLPPVYFLIRHRRRELVKDTWVSHMTDNDFEALAQFANKAAAWMLVGFGGLTIAFKETYELVENYKWPTVAFWALTAAMLMLSLSFGLSRVRWMNRRLEERRAGLI